MESGLLSRAEPLCGAIASFTEVRFPTILHTAKANICFGILGCSKFPERMHYSSGIYKGQRPQPRAASLRGAFAGFILVSFLVFWIIANRFLPPDSMDTQTGIFIHQMEERTYYMENTSIGARIKQRRKELGLTQVQIKEATGISSGNMSEIENGSKLPSTPALIALSSTLNCSIDWILKGETPDKQTFDMKDSRESLLLENFRKISEEDQVEIIEILQIKLNKSKQI